MGTLLAEKLNPCCVGIDVGQIHDYTAISIAEVSQVHTGKHRYIKPVPAHINRKGQFIAAKDTDPIMRSHYTIRFIQRVPLGTSYPDVAEYIADMLCKDLFQKRAVRVLPDVTGVGRGVFDLLKQEIERRKELRHIQLKPISFVHGEAYNRSKGTLGKAFLVSRLQSLLQSGYIHAPDTKEVKLLLEELRIYEIKITQDGKDTYGSSVQDDLATALGLSTLEDPFADRVSYSERVH